MQHRHLPRNLQDALNNLLILFTCRCMKSCGIVHFTPNINCARHSLNHKSHQLNVSTKASSIERSNSCDSVWGPICTSVQQEFNNFKMASLASPRGSMMKVQNRPSSIHQYSKMAFQTNFYIWGGFFVSKSFSNRNQQIKENLKTVSIRNLQNIFHLQKRKF